MADGGDFVQSARILNPIGKVYRYILTAWIYAVKGHFGPVCNVVGAVDVSVGCDATVRSFCVDFWDIF